MNGRLTGWVAVAGSVLALASCSTPPPGLRGDTVTYENYPNVTAADGLQPFLVVNGSNSYESGGLLHARVDARWTGDRYVYLEYRYLFRDRNGRVLNNSSPWRKAEAAPGTRVQLAGNATSPDAVDWNLEIRGQFN